MIREPPLKGIYPFEHRFVFEGCIQFGLGVQHFSIVLIALGQLEILLAAQFDGIAPAGDLITEGRAFYKFQIGEAQALQFSELGCDLVLDRVFYGIGLLGSAGL